MGVKPCLFPRPGPWPSTQPRPAPGPDLLLSPRSAPAPGLLLSPRPGALTFSSAPAPPRAAPAAALPMAVQMGYTFRSTAEFSCCVCHSRMALVTPLYILSQPLLLLCCCTLYSCCRCCAPRRCYYCCTSRSCCRCCTPFCYCCMSCSCCYCHTLTLPHAVSLYLLTAHTQPPQRPVIHRLPHNTMLSQPTVGSCSAGPHAHQPLTTPATVLHNHIPGYLLVLSCSKHSGITD